MIASNTTPITTGYVNSEGDDLYYEVRGTGAPLLMISGGGGDAGFYSLVAEILADEFKVITYDRRGNSRSSRHDPQNFEISQQSRDAVAVLHAAGESSAFVFGNSGGAIIALDMAKTQPQVIRSAVIHEAPIISLLPDYKRWQRFMASIYWMSWLLGPQVAMLCFSLSLGIPWHTMRSVPKEFSERNGRNQDFFVQHEMLPFACYCPNFAVIQRNNVRMSIAVGQHTLDKALFYGRPAPILAQKLACALVTFPGNHLSYFDLPEQWSASLRTLLQQEQSV
ncbi:MAG: alpha/beta hydrolase [Caldilineaceae bacterium]